MWTLIIIIGTIVLSLIALGVGIYLISDPEAEKGDFNFGISLMIVSFVLPLILSFFMEGISLNIFALITFVISASIIIEGIVTIPNKPISIALITKYGKLKWKSDKSEAIKEHGIRFIFLRGIIFDYRLMPVLRTNIDLPPQKVTTPDNAESEVPVSYTYTPGPNYLNYLKYGPINEETGRSPEVENTLGDKIREEVRIWASSEVEGPKTWQDLRGSGDEGTAILLTLVAGDNLDPIPSDIPPIKLFQFYGKIPFYPSEKSTIEQQKLFIQSKLPTSDDEKKKLEETINARWKLIKDLRKANGTQVIESLGITINRLNVGEIKVDPEIQKAIKKRVIENAEAEGEKTELDNVKARIFEHMFEVDENGKIIKGTDGQPIKTGITYQEASELVQSERGKVPKKIDVQRTELSFDKKTVEMVGTLATAIITALKGGKV